MYYGLQTTANIDGREVPIRTDFRVILDILEAINDPELDEGDKGYCALSMFYPDIGDIIDYGQAMDACYRFIDGGEKKHSNKKSPRLMDWAHDFEFIIAPVNRVLGYEARGVPYREWREENGEWKCEGGLHWWTFMAAYMEIGGDCTMSQIVGIRGKLSRNKKLDKQEREWYNRNRAIVDLPKRYTQAEEDLIRDWT